MGGRTGDQLYPGGDLRLAAERSSARSSGPVAVQGFVNAAGGLLDLARRRFGRREEPSWEWTVARGLEPGSGCGLTVGYAGDGGNRGWCLGTALTGHQIVERCENLRPEELARRLAAGSEAAELVFLDGLPQTRLPGLPASRLTLPAWVKQRVRMLGDWPAQIDGLRRDTRRETARMLRKYGYRGELTREAGDFRHFHDGLYRPYVSRRFGDSAQLVTRDEFLRQCRRGVLLRLFRGDRLVGASLLRPLGTTMAVVWSAQDPACDAAGTRGAADALDYFSLLYAHLRGCRWLDLGPSRPDLCDGVLRYKAKWGAEVHPGRVRQPTIRLGWRQRTPTVRGFLGRHAFIERDGRALRAVVVADRAPDAEARIAALETPGIREYRVMCAGDGP